MAWVITGHTLIEFKFNHFFFLVVNFLVFLFYFILVFGFFFFKFYLFCLQFFNLHEVFGDLSYLNLVLSFINFGRSSSIINSSFCWFLLFRTILCFLFLCFCFNSLQKFIIFVSIQNRIKNFQIFLRINYWKFTFDFIKWTFNIKTFFHFDLYQFYQISILLYLFLWTCQ